MASDRRIGLQTEQYFHSRNLKYRTTNDFTSFVCIISFDINSRRRKASMSGLGALLSNRKY